MAKPICFMVMPFGIKAVHPPVPGAPKQIDFDALWHKALAPVIEELGYEPVRADQETGAGILMEMLERLFFSDLVVADMTIANGNVYYEVGIRHASQQHGCVLISADWAQTLFDIDQMRRLVYPLPEGEVSDQTAEAIREALKQGTPSLAEGRSPMFQHIPGFPDPAKVDPERASSIRKQLDALSAFQARIRAVRTNRDAGERKTMALELRDDFPATKPMSRAAMLEMITLLRDCVDWDVMSEYLNQLPDTLQELDFVQEQRCLAKSKSGDHTLAIGALEELIRRRGDSSERRGLIGGRYKKLADHAKDRGDEDDYEDYLDQSIEQYELGMKQDLNDFYPTSNLPVLYRARNQPGDADSARFTAQLALLACERDTENPWRKPTMLTLAFFDGDLERARQYAKEVRREGHAVWQLDTTIATLERSVNQTEDRATRDALQAILDKLKRLLGQ